MTKRQHSCPFCRRLATTSRPMGEDMRRAFDKLLAEATFKHPGHPVPMRSGAELEQEARQRLAAWKRMAAEKQERMGRTMVEGIIDDLWRVPSGPTVIQTKPQVSHVYDSVRIDEALDGGLPAWTPCRSCEGWICGFHGGHVSDCACDPVGEPDSVWERLRIDPYAPGSLKAYRQAHQVRSDQTDRLVP